MKKALLLISFMMIFALTAFAQIDVSVSGNAEMTFGINLDGDVATGITNSSSAGISFTLVSGTNEKGAEDEGVHGYIKVGEWKASATQDGWSLTAGGVEAKIIFNDMAYLNILGASNKVNYMNPLEDNDGDDDATDEGVAIEVGKNGGVTLGLNIAPATVEIGIFSENDWTNDDNAADAVYDWIDDDDDPSTAPVWGESEAAAVDTDDSNTANNYGAHAKIVVAAGPATIDVSAVMGLYAGSNIGIGAKISAAVGPANLYVVTDMQVAPATAMEFGGGLSVNLADMVSIGLDATYGADMGDNLDMKVSLSKGGAILPELALGVAMVLNNLDVAVGWNVEVTASYATPTLKPYAKFYVDDASLMKLNIGAELYVITNVTFVLDYNTDDLGNSNGIVKFVTKISL
jgi:hypothetical protein